MKHTVYREQLLNMWIQFLSGQFRVLLPLGNIKSVKLPKPGYESAVAKVPVNTNRASWKGVTKRCTCVIFTNELYVENPLEKLLLYYRACLDGTANFVRELCKPFI